MKHELGEAPSPPQRVVLLGASNLTRGISTIVELARRQWGSPVEVLAALGHGRSYGMRSSVLGRALPGILKCGLWDALARYPGAPTAALLTDIGNDLLYHAPPEQVADWVEECLEKLAPYGTKAVVTGLPVCNLERLGAARFLFIRSLFVPSCRLDLKTVVERAWELQGRLEAIAKTRGVPLVTPQLAWYGFDPIHLRMRVWPEAWRDILSHWSGEHSEGRLKPSLARWLRLRSLAPQQRWLLGVEQRRAQPCARLRDGTTIAYY